MKAIAVLPGTQNSIHLRNVPDPAVDDVPDGRGVLVRVLRVGVDGTDREINAAEYGAAPPGDDYLILGHESFGQVLNADLVGAIGARYISTQDESLSQASARYGPFDYILLTHPVQGLERYEQLMQALTTADDAIKVYCEVASAAPSWRMPGRRAVA
jgi:hypothetical protein